jgi:hypothetical protein
MGVVLTHHKMFTDKICCSWWLQGRMTQNSMLELDLAGWEETSRYHFCVLEQDVLSAGNCQSVDGVVLTNLENNLRYSYLSVFSLGGYGLPALDNIP